VLLADLNQVDRPRESRLVEVRRVAGGDGHAPHGIEHALDFVVHVLAPRGQRSLRHAYPFPLGR
jgi:hypothetical protein